MGYRDVIIPVLHNRYRTPPPPSLSVLCVCVCWFWWRVSRSLSGNEHFDTRGLIKPSPGPAPVLCQYFLPEGVPEPVIASRPSTDDVFDVSICFCGVPTRGDLLETIRCSYFERWKCLFCWVKNLYAIGEN